MTETTETSWRAQLADYLYNQADPPHKYGHQPRLYALTRAIAARSPELRYDDDVVYAAAFLHDLGVFIGHRPDDPSLLESWDHVAYVCGRAPGLLARFGFPAEKVPAVLTAIREHQPGDEPTTPEATLLRDADILEQLGVIGLLRTASKIGSDTRFHLFADVERSLQRAIRELPTRLRLPAARELAEPRRALLSSILTALEEEAGQHLG